MNKRHGLGAMTYRSGDKYEGHWQHDRRHGKAQYINCSGDVFDGSYKNDLRDGPSTVTKVRATVLPTLNWICWCGVMHVLPCS